MLKINYKTTYLPAAIRQGSCNERLQKAIEMNNAFNTKMQHAFKYADVPGKGIKTILNKTINHPIPVDIMPYNILKKAAITHSLDENGAASGYTMFLPFNNATKGISPTSGNILLRQTMMLFQELLNPKYFKRFVNMFNKKYNIQSYGRFYEDNLYAKKPLSLEELNKFLKGKRSQEKIDALQFFRYSLIKEQNAQKYLKKLKEEYHIVRKLEIIEERLAKEIKSARNKNRKAILAKNTEAKN